MSVTYTGTLNVTCSTLAEFNKTLADAQANSDCTNIISDVNALTISVDISASN